MRRILAVLGLVCVVAAFVLIPLSIIYKINLMIPVGLFLASFLILTYVKKLPSELDGQNPENGAADAPEEPDGEEEDRNEQ